MFPPHPLMELRDMGSSLSPQLLEDMRREIARHFEEVYASEVASLKLRVDQLEGAVHASSGTPLKDSPPRHSPPLAAPRKGTGCSMSSESPSPSPMRNHLSTDLNRRAGAGTSMSSHEPPPPNSMRTHRGGTGTSLSSYDQPAPNSMRAHRGMTEELVLVDGRMVFRHEMDEQEVAPECLPESMFNYCVEQLHVTGTSWRDPAVGFLVLLTLSQNLLMNGFSQMNFKALVQLHWEPLDQRPKVLMDCVYADVMFMGESVLFLLVVLVCLVIVALVIKSATDGSLLVMFPDRDEKPGIWCFVTFVWFQQMVFIPAIFSIEAAALFSSSADTSALIMNTLAVAFILDVDKILYVGLLNEHQKAEYQALASHSDRPRQTRRRRQSSWLLFWCSLLQMCVHFVAIRIVIRDYSGRDFIRATLPLYSTYIIAGGMRGAVQTWATRTDESSWMAPSDIVAFLVCAVATPMWFFTIVWMTQGVWFDAMFRVSCFERELCISMDAC